MRRVSWDRQTKMAEKEEDLKTLSKQELISLVLKLKKDKEDLKLELRDPHEGNMGETGSEITCKPVSSSKKPKKDISQRAFDFSRYNKRRVAFKIAYLGWDFHGFASQETVENTIEGHLFSALGKARLIEDRTTANYSRCGRTDKGVSAFGQVVALDVRSNLLEGDQIIQTGDTDKVQQRTRNKVTTEIPYVQVMNKLLPPEIRVLAWSTVDSEFNARFSCSKRKYKYYFPSSGLDVTLMNEAAQRFVGEHDFRNICKMDVANGILSFQRKIESFSVRKLNDHEITDAGYDMCEAVICGSAFLWHQVRCMLALLFMIGRHLELPTVITELLDVSKCPRRPQYNMASELPLVLYDCAFEGPDWLYEPSVLETLHKDLQSQWTSHAVKATIAKALIDSLGSAAVTVDDCSWRKQVMWKEIRPQQFCQVFPLVPCQSAKQPHVNLMKRSLCDSFEKKLACVNAKRKRTGKEELVEKVSKMSSSV